MDEETEGMRRESGETYRKGRGKKETKWKDGYGKGMDRERAEKDKN